MMDEQQTAPIRGTVGKREHIFAFSFFAVSCSVVLSLLLFGSMRDVVLRFAHDDGFYYLRIATNWLQLHFSTFDTINPTNGYHPLLQWLLIVPSGLFKNMETFMRALSALGVLFVFFSGVLAYRTLTKYYLRTAVLVWYWLAGSLVFATIYGMEVSLTIFILSGLIYCLPKSTHHVNVERVIICGLLSGLLFLSRIDTIIWIAALDFMLLILCMRLHGTRRYWMMLIGFFCIQAGIIVGYFLYNLTVWGHLLTVSAMVKAGRTSLLSLDTPMSLLFLLAWVVTLFSAVILIRFLVLYREKRDFQSLFRFALPGWLSLANLLYMGAILVQGGPETYNWYFVTVVFSGAILLPYVVDTFQIRKVGLTNTRIFRIVSLFCFAILLMTLYGKIPPSIFVGAYNRATDLSLLPKGSVIFASGDCGILGTLSNQHCLNMDGLTNSFEFQEALRDNRFAEWLKNAGLNAYIGPKDEPIRTTATIDALPGIYGIARKVEVQLTVWDNPATNNMQYIRLYKIEGITAM